MTNQNRPPESRFAYVVVASRRARQLMLGAFAEVHSDCNGRAAEFRPRI